MSFIEVENGYINTAHVIRVSGMRDGRYALYDSNDVRIGITDYENWLAVTGPVVPAAPSTTAHLVWVSAFHSDPRPTKDDVCIGLHSVVAWRLLPDHKDTYYAYPILPEAPLRGTAILVSTPKPEGKLLRCDDRGFTVYDNINVAIADVLRQAQEDWDRAHVAKTAT